MPIKKIVADLDNTLLRRDKTISDYTVSIFKQLRNLDIITRLYKSCIIVLERVESCRIVLKRVMMRMLA